MPGTFPEVTGYRGGGPHGLKPGEWTDDTSMALALADSIASVGWDLNDQARRYIAWWRKGAYSVNGRCFDIGSTTRRGLARFEKTGEAKTSGDPSPQASGNGSIMRLVPAPIRYVGLFPESTGRAGCLFHRLQPADPCQPTVPVGVCLPWPRTMRADPRD